MAGSMGMAMNGMHHGGAGGAPTAALPTKRRWRVEPRHQIVMACFLATLAMYVERVGFSIAFTELAKSATLDESVKGTVLSAFFWGYALSQVPGGWAAQLYGGRVMLIISFTLWSTVSWFTPVDASNTLGVIIARVAIGIAQGFLIPSVHTVLSQWVPPHERARSVSLATSGMYLGSAAAMWVLPSVSQAFGASSLLKADGLLGYSWLLMWLLVGREIPHRPQSVSEALAECVVVTSLAKQPSLDSLAVLGVPRQRQETVIPLTTLDRDSRHSGPSKGRPSPTPWARMMASPAVWAIVVNNFSFHYAFYVVMNWLPTYFNHVLKVELSGTGAIKTLPYLVMFLMSNVGGWAGDWFITKRKMSVAGGRKAVNTLGFLAAAGALMLMPAAKGYLNGVAATTLTLGALGFSRGGFSVNHMDIAPKYAGVVMGISNTAGTLSGVIGVAVTGIILDWQGGASNLAGWYSAHSLCAGILLIAMAVFNLFARGERLFE